ncbi:hypothetical protein ABID56_000691 [Alkalibacillus flavidus]|uniref:Sporulation protein YtxC n=1 Tax=Alkalibacillus flavidus TaxID=546021 RepID=A0ABV2KSR1_9BACI
MKEWVLRFETAADARQWVMFSHQDKQFFSHVTNDPNVVRMIATESVLWSRWLDLLFSYVQAVMVPKHSKRMLKDHYYLVDEEIEQIMPFVLNLSEDTLPLHSQLTSLYSHLVRYVHQLETPYDISLSNLELFMFDGHSDWVDVVGYAIDEWQFEMQFQDQMERLRQWIDQSRSLYRRIDVYDADVLLFFDDTGKRIDQPTERVITDYLIIPSLTNGLLSLRPELINIFTNYRKTHALYQVKNLFQERATIFEEHEFPHEINNLSRS